VTVTNLPLQWFSESAWLINTLHPLPCPTGNGTWNIRSSLIGSIILGRSITSLAPLWHISSVRSEWWMLVEHWSCRLLGSSLGLSGLPHFQAPWVCEMVYKISLSETRAFSNIPKCLKTIDIWDFCRFSWGFLFGGWGGNKVKSVAIVLFLSKIGTPLFNVLARLKNRDMENLPASYTLANYTVLLRDARISRWRLPSQTFWPVIAQISFLVPFKGCKWTLWHPACELALHALVPFRICWCSLGSASCDWLGKMERTPQRRSSWAASGSMSARAGRPSETWNVWMPTRGPYPGKVLSFYDTLMYFTIQEGINNIPKERLEVCVSY
jgi:hypothetical protein